MYKVVIVISILIGMLSEKVYSQAQLDDYGVLNSISDYISTHNSDSLIRVYNKTLQPEWNQLLKMEVLNRNICAKVDSGNNLSPFDPVPIAKYLTEDDLDDMKKNYEVNNFRKWRMQGLGVNTYKVIKKKPKIKSVKNSPKFKDYVEISSPVYSKDRKIVVIVMHRYCGMECGEGTLYVFENKYGKWNHLCQVPLWIS